MHLVIPFAAPLSDAGRRALASLALPRLAAFAARAEVVHRDEGDELSLSPPHERALARALGLAGGDGQLPWAAWWAAADGVDIGDLAWALLSPTHWHLGTDQVSLGDPEALALDETGSRAFLAVVQELFTSEGFVVAYGAPTRWYVAHESLAELPCASPDRVIGRNVDRWLPGRRGAGAGDSSRLIRRLQNEVQMQLHEHPLNQARERQGLPVLNSVWISGCGRAQAAKHPAPDIDARLRAPALAEDWAAWCKAWDTLDAGPVAALSTAAEAGAAAQVTLCGERSSLTLAARPRSAWQRLAMRWRRPSALPWLEGL